MLTIFLPSHTVEVLHTWRVGDYEQGKTVRAAQRCVNETGYKMNIELIFFQLFLASPFSNVIQFVMKRDENVIHRLLNGKMYVRCW